MNIIFAGTPAFSVPGLQALIDAQTATDIKVTAVYTQPDRPAGRGKKLQSSPVKQAAEAFDIPVYQPARLDQQAIQDLKAQQPDLMVVIAYGLLLPQAVLDIPTLGCVNVHASLLPRWRGAAPIQRAIQAGDDKTGVCLMQMEKGLDTGPVLARAETEIREDDTGGSLHDRLASMGGELLSQKLVDLLAQKLQPEVQVDSLACYAHKLSKSEARIDWTTAASQIDRMVRAFNPWPGSDTTLHDMVIRVHAAQLIEGNENTDPGTIIEATKSGIDVLTGKGLLRITHLQKKGGKVLACRDFLNGTPVKPGDQFDSVVAQ